MAADHREKIWFAGREKKVLVYVGVLLGQELTDGCHAELDCVHCHIARGPRQNIRSKSTLLSKVWKSIGKDFFFFQV